MIKAPWSDEQIDKLNRFQRAGFMHPFTCENCSDRELIATYRGWICCCCDYTQDWAHEFMLEEPVSPFHGLFAHLGVK